MREEILGHATACIRGAGTSIRRAQEKFRRAQEMFRQAQEKFRRPQEMFRRPQEMFWWPFRIVYHCESLAPAASSILRAPRGNFRGTVPPER